VCNDALGAGETICSAPCGQILIPRFFNPRTRSLARGNVLVLGSVFAAIPISHFPHIRPTLWLLLPALSSLIGTAETVRCIQRRWSLYHAGVILCIYMDLMGVSLVLFLLLYPYFGWMSSTP
jgi:hypothetical protein